MLSSMLRLHGQEGVVQRLDRSIAAGRIHHAYLFAGPEHLGKTTLAIQLAQTLNCTAPDPPCDVCGACTRVLSGTHADDQYCYVGMPLPDPDDEADTVIPIAAIRDVIRHFAQLRPYEGRTRVFIILEADRMSAEASDALLKVLEEPPSDVVFVLTSDRPELLPATIQSRCQILQFHPLPLEQVSRILRDAYRATDEQSEVLGRLSRGSVGWAIQASKEDAIYADVHQRLERIADAVEGTLETRFSYANELARRFRQNRRTVREDLRLWLQWLRDIVLIQQGLGPQIVNLPWRGTLERQASQLQPAESVRWAHGIAETIELLDRNANPRLALEALMIDAPKLMSN